MGGEWAEVKTLVVAEVVQNEKGEVDTTQVSSFSRLAEIETFSQQAVCAVTDGAEWIQGFIDDHCPSGVRMLDFAHAAEYVSEMGQTAAQAGSALTKTWLAERLHQLKHEGPVRVLAELRQFQSQHPPDAVLSEDLAYLEKREAHMQYPRYQQQGWPIGSGMVESANKLVVEARLKGAGMHWERVHVNPMLVLRNAVCNQRWQEIWQTGVTQRHMARRLDREERTTRRLTSACCSILIALNRLRRLATPSPPIRSAKYSWKQPFLRLPPYSQNPSAK